MAPCAAKLGLKEGRAVPHVNEVSFSSRSRGRPSVSFGKARNSILTLAAAAKSPDAVAESAPKNTGTSIPATETDLIAANGSARSVKAGREAAPAAGTSANGTLNGNGSVKSPNGAAWGPDLADIQGPKAASLSFSGQEGAIAAGPASTGAQLSRSKPARASGEEAQTRTTSNGATSSGNGALAASPKLLPAQRKWKGEDSSRSYVVGKEPDVPPSLFEYFEACKSLDFADTGPPRFFCPVDARPSGVPAGEVLPKLFFLPGIEGTGYGLALHHKTLARIFELSCLHVPVNDRTPFLALVLLVEQALQEEHRQNPGRAIFVLGESFGAVLTLAVAERNPELPLTLILVNPATSFPRSQFQPLLPLISLIPDPLFPALPVALSFSLGNPTKMAQGGLRIDANPLEKALGIRENLLKMIPTVPDVAKLLPRDTLLWKLELLKEASQFVEPLLERISFPTLILASEEDNLIPSKEEAQRLKKEMKKSKVIVREFKESGHTLLLEGGLDLANIIKGSSLYRKTSSRRENPLVDSFPSPTVEDLARVRTGTDGLIRFLSSPVFFSTKDDGQIIQGFSGVPTDHRPILFVGNHQTFAPDLSILVGEFLDKTGVLMRGLAHPMAMGLFQGETGAGGGMSDTFRIFGAVPVTPTMTYKLLANGEAVLLFPGGAREALKNRGEEYKLFWPDKAEFIRMAIKLKATIVPFAAVGVDDSYSYVVDGQEILNNPFLGSRAKEFMEAAPKVRDESAGPAMEQFVPPVVLPSKVNRMYFLFRKAIKTTDLAFALTDKAITDGLYRHVKQEVEDGLEYLLMKREEDPYKELSQRLAYEASWGGKRQAPTFSP